MGCRHPCTTGAWKSTPTRVENLIRPIALNRKSALFAGHNRGGIAWGRIASLIETCKINDVEPFAYLRATLTSHRHRPASTTM